jgi:hypothetical protein
MSRRTWTLTEFQVEEAFRLRKIKGSKDPRTIAKLLGVSEDRVREALGMSCTRTRPTVPRLKRAIAVPECLLLDRDQRLYEDDRSLNQIHLGDPPRGQSALDKLRSPWSRNV